MDQEHITLESVNEKLLLLTRQFEELKDDLEFARRTEEALDRVEKGEYISVDSQNLEEEMAKW
jgi:hypothetical protein